MDAHAPILSQETTDRITNYVADQIRARGIPGATLAIGIGNQVVYARGFGVADAERGTAVSSETPFELASVTKSITATAILQLRDAGLIDLDAPVRRYLPWFQVGSPWASEAITLRHLLTHTSGIPGSAIGVVWRDWNRLSESMTEACRALAGVRSSSRPGTRYEYCNMGYVVLGVVVEAVSGVPWAQYVQEQIFAPLGMNHSTADYDHSSLALAKPYAWHLTGRRPVLEKRVAPYLAAAGSTVATSAPDLVRFGQLHLGQRPVVLAPSTAVEAHLGVAQMPWKMKYGLGWVDMLRRDGLRAVWHNGSGEGCGSVLTLLPDRGITVALLANAKALVDPVANGVIELLLGRAPKQGRAVDPIRVMMGYIPAWLTWYSALLATWGAADVVRGAPAGLGLRLVSTVTVLLAVLLAGKHPFATGLPLRQLPRWFPGFTLAAVSMVVSGILTAALSWAPLFR